MIDKKTITILVSILHLFVGCNQNSTTDEGFITVDVTAKYPLKELILQDFMDVEYIPLETNDEFITTAYVQAIGKDIILVRNTNRVGAGNIFIFDRKGKALKKINRRGQSNKEYTNISGQITLDEDKGEIFVSCIGLRKVLVYDLSGNFKRSFMFKEGSEESGRFKNEIHYEPMYNFDQDYLICQDGSSGRNFVGKDNFDLEARNLFNIVSKQNGSVIKEIEIPFEKKISQVLMSNAGIGVVRNPGLIPNYGEWILTDPSSDTIYSYSSDHSLKPFIVRTPSIQLMNPEVFLYPGVITDQYYFMQTVKKEINETDTNKGLFRTDIVYDREKRKIFEYTVLNGDFTNKRIIKNLTDNILTLTVVNNNEIAFAEKIEAFDLVEAYQNGQLKGKLKEIAAVLNEESNPVIMLVKHKK